MAEADAEAAKTPTEDELIQMLIADYKPLVPQYTPGNRDSIIAAINQMKSAQNPNPAQWNSDQHNLAIDLLLGDDFHATDRDFYTNQGRDYTKSYLRDMMGSAFDTNAADIDDQLTRYIYGQGKFEDVTGTDLYRLPQQKFGQPVAQNIYDSLLNRRRNEYMGQAQQFAPGRVYSDVPDSSLDSIIESIIAEQRPLAAQGIEYAKKRGQLNDTGYQLAQDRLNTREGEVRSNLRTQGGSLLEALRGRLGTIGESARADAADTPNFFDIFDPSTYGSQYSSTLEQGMSGLEGSLRNLVTPDEFNTRDLIGYGGARQGQVNNPTMLLETLEQNRKKREASRGLGTQGAF